jgi:hypothetical protein
MALLLLIAGENTQEKMGSKGIGQKKRYLL